MREPGEHLPISLPAAFQAGLIVFITSSVRCGVFSTFPGFPSHMQLPVPLFWCSSLLSLGTSLAVRLVGQDMPSTLLCAGNAAYLSDAQQRQAMSLGRGQNLSCWDSLGWGPHLNASTDSIVTPGKSLNVSGHPSQTKVTPTMMTWQVLSWKPSHGTL